MRKRSRRIWFILGLVALVSCAGGATAWASWTTYRGDAGRSGIDTSSSGSLPLAGAWTSSSLGGNVWGQPLVFDGLVIVATEGDDVYALNESSGQVAWHTSVGTPVPSNKLPCGDISPTVGITSTPVIDPVTGRVFVAADTWDGSNAQHKLFALDLATGAVAAGFPVAIDPPGADHKAILQRTALALTGGRVVIGYGGNDGDCGTYHGWLVSVPETGGSLQSTFEVEPQSGATGGAIWGSGDGPAVDSAGDLWVETGNGFGSGYGYQESVLKLDPALSLLDHWAPSNWQYLDNNDIDLGSADPLALPNGLWFVIGKQGVGYLLAGSHLGGTGASPVYSAPVCAGSFGGAVYYNGRIYVGCSDGVRALALNTGTQTFSSVSGWNVTSGAIGPPIVAGGTVWSAGWGANQLFGLSPQTGDITAVQSHLPTMMHFSTPSASDGKLFLATGQTVEAFTIANPSAAAPPPGSSGPSGSGATTTAPTCGCRGPHCQTRLALTVPRHTRVVSASVYFNHRRIKRKRGHRLTAVWFASPAHRRTFTVRLIETTSTGRRLVRFIHFQNCRRVTRRAATDATATATVTATATTAAAAAATATARATTAGI